MEQKKYTINDKEFTLAPPTPQRTSRYCGILGVEKFSDFSDADVLEAASKRLMDFSTDPVKVAGMLDICLAENTAEIVEPDLRIFDTIATDFLMQRVPKSHAPAKPATESSK